ncbi:MAG: hypothetical protein ACKOXB_05020 [Flavobacteriales bacterium]
MNRKLYFYIFLLSALYGLQLLCKFRIVTAPQWFISYFGDLLCMPLLLCFTLMLMRKIKRIELLHWKMILFALIYVSVIFEFILPRYSSKYTSDMLDIIMYSIGSFAFYLLQKNTIKQKTA